MFKKGQQVVKVISIQGLETASIRTVEKVNKKKGFAYLDLDDLADDGQNTYKLADGHANVCWVPGCSHRIITLEE